MGNCCYSNSSASSSRKITTRSTSDSLSSSQSNKSIKTSATDDLIASNDSKTVVWGNENPLRRFSQLNNTSSPKFGSPVKDKKPEDDVNRPSTFSSENISQSIPFSNIVDNVRKSTGRVSSTHILFNNYPYSESEEDAAKEDKGDEESSLFKSPQVESQLDESEYLHKSKNLDEVVNPMFQRKSAPPAQIPLPQKQEEFPPERTAEPVEVSVAVEETFPTPEPEPQSVSEPEILPSVEVESSSSSSFISETQEAIVEEPVTDSKDDEKDKINNNKPGGSGTGDIKRKLGRKSMIFVPVDAKPIAIPTPVGIKKK